ncbi:hypothetical protein CHS0354_000818 [Potamilus streckersoni]|uniref:Uncharacterized protein n=1 Tax=Potamilus streckersoni TaxID=2493646 RepID=A0AAE0T895_9BIVA|nr:hypothetical protein CHS0354_000818 [Potamilus streckersoni]
MSDQELKHIVASLAISIKEVSVEHKKTEKLIKELSVSQKKTDEQIKELFASQKKTDEQIKELFASQKKTDEQIKELFASQKETDAQIKELSASQKKTESTLKGLGFNVGMAVEEYFYNSLDLTKKVANIQFDDCQKNLHGFNRELKLQDEFDITMANTTKGLLVECKHHVVKEDVVKLRESKVKNLKILYPDFKDLEMYLAVAGASFDLDAKQEAKQSGIIILKQDMSDQELKHIVASLAISIKEVSAQIKELSASQKKTDEQIKELFASQKKTDAQQKKTDAQQKKTDEQIKELSASQKKTDEQIKELSVEHKKTDEQIKELFASQKKTDEQIKELSVEHKKTESTLKGLGFNVGMAVEEYFYNSLDLTKKVANIQFDDCQKNLHGFNRELKLQDEFDITMANTTKGLLVECKHHVVKEDVVKLRESKVKNLKILYPDFKDLEMYLAVAGASFDSDAKQEAKQSGIIILKQVGDVMEEEVENLKTY